MARVELRGISKTFPGGVLAVAPTDLEIADGEFVVLVGPSGCGKSTLLRMVAGLEEPTAGTVTIGDRVVNGVEPKDRNVAMVFQSYALYPHMSVRENLAFGLRMRKVPAPEIRRKVQETAEVLGIGELLDRKPRALSGGQRQRVALGRAIVRDPQVFLFDEPLSNLDAKMRVQMRTEISRLHHQLRSTMIYVTHDQTEAMTLGQRIVVLKGGLVQQVDTPLALYERPVNRFVAGFIGSPAMNFLRGRLERQDGLRLVLAANGGGAGLETVPLPPGMEPPASLLSRELVLGVRPEHVRVVEPGTPGRFARPLQVLEPLGNESLLYFALGGETFVARAPGIVRTGIDQEVGLALDAAHLHLFEAEGDGRSLL